MHAATSSWADLLFTLALGTGALAAEAPAAAAPVDPWGPVRPLVGRWQGEGEGFGSVSDVTHEWRFVLQGRFLRLTTRSVQRAETGVGETHEDVGYVSHDVDTGTLVLRQFLSEGYVNVFDIVVGEDRTRSILFRPRASEGAGGMRARMHLHFADDDTYEMVLDLAAPGRDFAACQRMRMKRVP